MVGDRFGLEDLIGDLAYTKFLITFRSFSIF